MANTLVALNMIWKIQNSSNCWFLKKGDRIVSPDFTADEMEHTKWSLLLYPMGHDSSENAISVFLQREEDFSGPDNIEVSFQLAFLGKDDSMLKTLSATKEKFAKNRSLGFNQFERQERVFVSEREAFLPGDTLTVQCTVWTTDEKPVKLKNSFASTTIKIKRGSLVLEKDKPSTLKSGKIIKFKDNLVDFDLVLNEGFDGQNIDMTSFDETIKYISCNVSITDSEVSKKKYQSKEFSPPDLKKRVLSFILNFLEMLTEDKSQCFSNGVLSLDFEFVLATVEHSGYRIKCAKLEKMAGHEKCQNTIVPNADFKLLYNDGIFSDMEIRTSTKTFPVHKAVLSARSPVFRSMFSHDMKEKSSGHVDITDFEDETVHQMLLYVYLNPLEDLQFESACKLYKIADKYQILSLKSMCSSILKEKLCPVNACNALVFADLHNDDYLKSSVQDYILRQREEVFCSQEWKDFMETHPKLAANLMYREITNNLIYLPRKRKLE